MSMTPLGVSDRQRQLDTFVDFFVKEFIAEIGYLEDTARGNRTARTDASLAMMFNIACALVSLAPIPGGVLAFVALPHILNAVTQVVEAGLQNELAQSAIHAASAYITGNIQDKLTVKDGASGSFGLEDDTPVDIESLSVLARWLGVQLARRYEQVLTERLSTQPDKAIIGLARVGARRCLATLAGNPLPSGDSKARTEYLLSGVLIGAPMPWYQRPLKWIKAGESLAGRNEAAAISFVAENVYVNGAWIKGDATPKVKCKTHAKTEWLPKAGLFSKSLPLAGLPKYGYVAGFMTAPGFVLKTTSAPDLVEWQYRRLQQPITKKNLMDYLASAAVTAAKKEHRTATVTLTQFLYAQSPRTFPQNAQPILSDDLRDLALTSGNFQGVDFSGSQFCGDLSHTSFESARLYACCFTEVSSDANSTVNFAQAALGFSTLLGARYAGNVSMTQADLTCVDFTNATFGSVDHLGAIWHKTILTGVNYNALRDAQKAQVTELAAEQAKQRDHLNAMNQKIQALEAKMAPLFAEGSSAADREKIEALLLAQVNRLQFEVYATEKLEQLQKRSDLHEVAIQQLNATMITVREERLAGERQLQTQIDQLGQRVDHLESRVTAIEPQWPTAKIPEKHQKKPLPLHALLGDYNRSFENPRLQNTLHYYIEPTALPFKGADIEPHPLSESLEKFENDDKNILLVHGDVGAGKSSIARCYQKKLWDTWKNDSSLTPLLIELKQVSSDNPNFLKEELRLTYGYSDKQIETLQKTYRFLIILDGLDECPHAVMRHILQDCEIHEWRAKVLITARTEWLNAQNNYQKILTTNTRTSIVYTLSECFVAPFSKVQIDIYLEKRYNDDALPWTKYRDFLYQTEELANMAKSPVMLHILCEVLPTLVAQAGQGQIKQYTRFGLYDIFLSAWFDREIAKEHTLKTLQTQSDETLKTEFLYYTQALAFTMLREKTLFIRKRHQATLPKKTLGAAVMATKKDPWSDFFDNPDNLQAQRSCPLSIERFEKDGERHHSYQFIHKSFMEHAASTWLWGVLEDVDATLEGQLILWNHRILTEELGIIAFLAERLITSPTREREEATLLKMVMETRTQPNMAQAASSAISVLNAAHTDFQRLVPDRDLSGIHIPHADLSGAFLEYFNFSDSNVSQVIFHNAVLYQALFNSANLTNTQFLPGDSFVLCNEKVGALALHPHQPDIAAYGEGSDIVIVRLSDGYIEKRLQGHTNTIIKLIFSPTGLLVSGDSSASDNIRIWDIERNAQQACIKILRGNPFGACSFAFSPTGLLVSGGAHDRAISIWDLHCSAESACIKTLVVKDDSIRGIFSLVFSPSGLLASGSDEHTIHIWDIDRSVDEACVKILKSGGIGQIESLAFSPLGLLASCDPYNVIHIWDIACDSEKARIKSLKGHTGGILSLIFSPAGLLVSGSRDRSIRIWDVERSGENNCCISTILGHTDNVNSLAFSSQGLLISGSTDYTIRTWDIQKKMNEDHQVIATGHERTIESLVVSSKGYLATACMAENRIRIWDVKLNAKKSCIKTLSSTHWLGKALAFSPAGFLATGVSCNGYLIHIWDVEKDICIKTLEIQSQRGYESSFVTSIAFSQVGLLASGRRSEKQDLFSSNPMNRRIKTYTYAIHIWNLERKAEAACINIFSGHTANVNSLVFLSTDILASGSNDNTIRLWNIEQTAENACIKTLTGHTSSITILACSSTGLLVSGSRDKTIRIWDINSSVTKSCIKILEGHTDTIVSFSFSPNGQWLISSSCNEILCWNPHNWNKAPICIPFGASCLTFNGNLLCIGKNNSLITLNLSDLPRKLDWVMAVPPQLQLTNCHILEAQGITSTTQKLLEREGALFVQPNNSIPINVESTASISSDVVISGSFSTLFSQNNATGSPVRHEDATTKPADLHRRFVDPTTFQILTQADSSATSHPITINDFELRQFNFEVSVDIVKTLADFYFGEKKHNIQRGKQAYASLLFTKINLDKELVKTSASLNFECVTGKTILNTLKKCEGVLVQSNRRGSLHEVVDVSWLNALLEIEQRARGLEDFIQHSENDDAEYAQIKHRSVVSKTG